MRKILTVFSFLFICMLAFNIVSAIPPVQTTIVAEKGLEIEATNSLYLEYNTTHTFHFRVYNSSDNTYISPDDVTCSLGILNNEGTFLFSIDDATAVGFRFDVEVLGGNFTDIGVYHKGINCLLDDGTAGGVLTQSFEITANGKENPDGITILGFVLMMMIIFMSVAVFLVRAIGLMIDASFDILDLAMAWGLYFGLLGLNQLAGIYLGTLEVMSWLSLFIIILAFPLVVVPVVAFFLSLFRENKTKQAERQAW